MAVRKSARPVLCPDWPVLWPSGPFQGRVLRLARLPAPRWAPNHSDKNIQIKVYYNNHFTVLTHSYCKFINVYVY